MYCKAQVKFVLNIRNISYQFSLLEGKWTCHVVTADKDDLPPIAHERSPRSREVSLIVYGSDSVQGPLQLISTEGCRHLSTWTNGRLPGTCLIYYLCIKPILVQWLAGSTF